MRLQLDVPEEQIQEMERLMEETGLATRKDLFNNALTLFEWAINERKAGRLVASVNTQDHQFKEVVMPPLERAARQSDKVTRKK